MNYQTDHYITGDPAFGVNRNGVVVLWNKESEQVFGYPSTEALGQKCWELLCGQDINGNRYCFENCPLIEMAFSHEPIHAFLSSFTTSSQQQKQFAVSCLTVFNQPGDEMLLHICHPEKKFAGISELQTPSRMSTDSLSQREIEILALLTEGVSTRSIASRLSISVRTVRTHIQHLMYKLRVHKRRDAILKGKRLKLV